MRSSKYGVRVAGLLICVCTPSGVARAATAVPARPADALVDSMGTNIHSAFGGNFVTNPQGIVDAIRDIGFRYVRDVPTTPDRLNALTDAAGLKVCVIGQYYWYGSDAFDVKNFDAAWDQIQRVHNIAFLEFPNEPQNFDDYDGKLHAWAGALYQAAKADPRLASVPMIACTAYGPSPNLADLSPYCDFGNVHSYPNIYTNVSNLSGYVGVARTVTGDKPIIATETGYNNAVANPSVYRGVSEAAAAKYLPRLFLDNFNAGIVKTFNYEFIDSFVDDTYTNGEASFGLLHTDLSYKPAARALKNLIGLLKDPGPAFKPSSLAYTLTTSGGAGVDIHQTLLQKRDGAFWLAVWQNALSYDPNARQDIAVAPVDVSLRFEGVPVVSATTYVPNESADPAGADVRAAQVVSLAVDDGVTLVRLRLAAAGDTNADGLVGDADVHTFLRHYGETVSADAGWAAGDFDRDGEVGFGDFQMLERNYGQSVTPALVAEVAAVVASVPEPVSPAVVAAGGLLAALASGRRR